MTSPSSLTRLVVASSLLAAVALSSCGSDDATTEPVASSADSVVATIESGDAVDSTPDSAPTETDAVAEPDTIVDDVGEATGACGLFTLDEIVAAVGAPVVITEGNGPEQCDYEGEDKLPLATVLVQPDDGDQLQVGRIVLDSLADSVDEITVAGFSGVHGHDLDAGFATYDTAAVSTGPTIVSVSLYGGDSAARSASVLGLLELGVPRL